MAESKTVEQYLADAEELVRIYEEVSQTELPHSVQEARREGWRLLPRAIVVAGLVHYEPDDRKEDGTRLISLPVALQMIEDFEDSLLTKTVKNPRQIFVSKVRGLVGIAQQTYSAIPILWDLVKATIDIWDVLDLLAWLARLGFIFDIFTNESRLRALAESMYEIVTRYTALLIGGTLAAFALPLFSATVIAVEKEREFWVARMRKAALPQRNQRRVWRRKVSRL